jgi:cell wall-associated NlpC family hydrolase
METVEQTMMADMMLAAHGEMDGLGIEEQAQRLAVVQESLAWLGTPWRHQARVMGAGVDCGQILAAVFEAAGVLPHVDPGDYPRDFMLHADEERFLGTVEAHAQRVDGPALPGDIALFRYGRVLSHAGIVICWPTIVHAYVKAGEVVLDNVEANKDLEPRLAGIWSPWGRN